MVLADVERELGQEGLGESRKRRLYRRRRELKEKLAGLGRPSVGPTREDDERARRENLKALERIRGTKSQGE